MSVIHALPAPEVKFAAPVDEKWERERRAFVRMLPELLGTYRNQFVAVHEEQVVASGPDKIAVALQAYRDHGQIPVYVGLVSEQPASISRLPSPRTLRH